MVEFFRKFENRAIKSGRDNEILIVQTCQFKVIYFNFVRCSMGAIVMLWGGVFLSYFLFVYLWCANFNIYFDKCGVLNDLIEPAIFIFKINTNKISNTRLRRISKLIPISSVKNTYEIFVKILNDELSVVHIIGNILILSCDEFITRACTIP